MILGHGLAIKIYHKAFLYVVCLSGKIVALDQKFEIKF